MQNTNGTTTVAPSIGAVYFSLGMEDAAKGIYRPEKRAECESYVTGYRYAKECFLPRRDNE